MGEDGACEGTCEETCDKEISLKTNEALPLVSRWLEYQAAPKQKSKFKSITSGFFPNKTYNCLHGHPIHVHSQWLACYDHFAVPGKRVSSCDFEHTVVSPSSHHAGLSFIQKRRGLPPGNSRLREQHQDSRIQEATA